MGSKRLIDETSKYEKTQSLVADVAAQLLQLHELVVRGSDQSYDSLLSQYSFQELSFTQLKAVYKARTHKTFTDTDYEAFGLVDANGQLTNAGALLADESPVRHSRLFCTRWQGLTMTSGLAEALDDQEISGSLISLLQEGLKFVRGNSHKAWRKLADRREEYPDYPEQAVFEGLVNALIHRSYTELGSEVHIDMFDDRMEISSPGGMVSGESLAGKDLLHITSKCRNPILADIFSRLHYMERRGSGFKKIIADYSGQVLFTEAKKPFFQANTDDFLLTLYNLNYIDNDTQGDTHSDTQTADIDTQDVKTGMKVSKNDVKAKIIELIQHNSHITTSEIAKELAISVSTVKRRIKAMDNILYEGSGYSGHWVIKHE